MSIYKQELAQLVGQIDEINETLGQENLSEGYIESLKDARAHLRKTISALRAKHGVISV